MKVFVTKLMVLLSLTFKMNFLRLKCLKLMNPVEFLSQAKTFLRTKSEILLILILVAITSSFYIVLISRNKFSLVETRVFG